MNANIFILSISKENKMNFDALTLGGFLLTILIAGLLLAIHAANDRLSQLHRRLRGCGTC